MPSRLAPCSSRSNCISSLAERARQRVTPLRGSGSADETLARLQKILESMDRVRIVTATDGYIHAEFVSLVFRYVDDLELLVDRREDIVHVRSASRVGHWDLGANRRRVEDLRRRLGGR